MTRNSIQPRNRTFVKGFEFFSFAKNMGKNTGKNLSKNLSGKCSPGMLAMRQKYIGHAKQSSIDAFKTVSKRAIQKAAEATGDMIGNKITNKITNVSKHSQKNN